MRVFCFQIDASDNVATLLGDAKSDELLEVWGKGEIRMLRTLHPIQADHKVALRPIHAEELILKYGVPIGRARKPIAAGEWVHLHNCLSLYDAKSSSLDLHTGINKDVHYE